MSALGFAHQTSENALCPRFVYVCPQCGWWKAEAFDCRHMVTATDGEPAFRDYRSARVQFYLWGEVEDEIAKFREGDR